MSIVLGRVFYVKDWPVRKIRNRRKKDGQWEEVEGEVRRRKSETGIEIGIGRKRWRAGGEGPSNILVSDMRGTNSEWQLCSRQRYHFVRDMNGARFKAE